MENLTTDINELFAELVQTARDQGALSREEWNETVEELLEERRADGELSEDADWAQMREELQGRYEELASDIDAM